MWKESENYYELVRDIFDQGNTWFFVRIGPNKRDIASAKWNILLLDSKYWRRVSQNIEK